MFSKNIFFRAEAASKSENRMKIKTTTYLPLVPRGSLIFTSGSPENLLKTFAPVGIFVQLENDAHYENVDPEKTAENVDPEKIEEKIAPEKTEEKIAPV